MKDFGFVYLVAIIRAYESVKNTEKKIIEIVELIADFIRKLEKLIFCKEDKIIIRENN